MCWEFERIHEREDKQEVLRGKVYEKEGDLQRGGPRVCVCVYVCVWVCVIFIVIPKISRTVFDSHRSLIKNCYEKYHFTS